MEGRNSSLTIVLLLTFIIQKLAANYHHETSTPAETEQSLILIKSHETIRHLAGTERRLNVHLEVAWVEIAEIR